MVCLFILGDPALDSLALLGTKSKQNMESAKQFIMDFGRPKNESFGSFVVEIPWFDPSKIAIWRQNYLGASQIVGIPIQLNNLDTLELETVMLVLSMRIFHMDKSCTSDLVSLTKETKTDRGFATCMSQEFSKMAFKWVLTYL